MGAGMGYVQAETVAQSHGLKQEHGVRLGMVPAQGFPWLGGSTVPACSPGCWYRRHLASAKCSQYENWRRYPVDPSLTLNGRTASAGMPAMSWRASRWNQVKN